MTGSERAPGGPTCRRGLGRGGRDAHLQGDCSLFLQVLSISKVVKEVGKRMMEKAYMGMSHDGSNALTNEE